MKRATLLIIAIFIWLSFQPLQSKSALTSAPSTVVSPKPEETVEAKVLLQRLKEIKSIDKSNLKSTDKKNLRKEVRSIQNQLKVIDGGVYLSVGTIIIILLLLIILF